MPMSLPNFSSFFDGNTEVTSVACGRVNLIGEHTDYNGGFVLPTAIPQKTTIQLKARSDKKVRVVSPAFNSVVEEFELGKEQKKSDWVDYIKGCTTALTNSGTKLERGFDALISSDVPRGSGLSSSAALEISLLKGICELFKLPLDPIAIAQVGQKAEVDFVGARVGIMDQMACSLAQEGEALFLDTKSLKIKQLKIRAPILVIHSGVTHNHSAGDYNQRRAECESACATLGIGELRELSASDLDQAQKKLSPLHFRRVKHVVTENERVLAAVAALETNSFEKLGDLFGESHASMRDDYEVSVKEVDSLVEIADSQQGVLGARLTGGGFGGSIVVLIKPGSDSLKIGREILKQYKSKVGIEATLLVPKDNQA